MFLPQISTLVALSLIFEPSSSFSISKRQDQNVSVETTFDIDQSCSSDQSNAIQQANKDALALAQAGLEDAKELLIQGQQDYYVDFTTEAAIDYWGPTDLNAPYQQKIFDTLYRATQAYRGWGWDDYWANRRVTVLCHDTSDSECAGSSPAYTQSESNQLYPVIIFCPPFFNNLSSHNDLVNKIKEDTTDQMKLNLRNLRSQGKKTVY